LVADQRPAAGDQRDDVTVVFDRLDHDHDGDSSATRAARGPAEQFRHTLAAVL
jgi:hypothetical protein